MQPKDIPKKRVSPERANIHFAERISKPENLLASETNQYDERVTKLAYQLQRGLLNLVSIEDSITALRNDMTATFQTVRVQENIDLVDVFRFANHFAMLDQRIIAPYAFAEKGRYGLRKQLVNGSYGVNASILDTAIKLYDNNMNDADKCAQLRGVINDQTPMAIIHRPESPSETAYSSTISDDHLYKSDFKLLRMDGRPSNTYNIQSKSSRHSQEEDHDTQEPIHFIYADDFDNRTADGITFPTTRLIVQEVAGTISDENKKRLDGIDMSFMNHLHKLVETEQ